jgi:hypothetical protein
VLRAISRRVERPRVVHRPAGELLRLAAHGVLAVRTSHGFDRHRSGVDGCFRRHWISLLKAMIDNTRTRERTAEARGSG